MAEDTSGLTQAEQAYFDSRGEKLPEGFDETAGVEAPAEKAPAAPEQPAEKPAEKAADTAPETQAAEAKEEPSERKTVPITALHEEREARKAAQQRARELEQQLQRLSGRLDVLNQAINPQQQTKPLDPREQPVEAVVVHEDRLRALEERTRAEEQNRHFSAALAASTQEFAKRQPDLQDAFNYLERHRTEELRTAGIADADIPAIIVNEAAQISSLAFQQGANPAERLYNIAKTRGYAPKPAEPEHKPGILDQPRGPDGKFAPADKIETVAKAQKAAKSLSASGGGGATDLTLESLASMTDDEFAALTDKAWRKAWLQ